MKFAYTLFILSLTSACTQGTDVAADEEATTEDDLRGGGQGGGRQGVPATPADGTFATNVQTYAATDQPPGPVHLRAPFPAGFSDAFPGSPYVQGSSRGLRIQKADGGEFPHPARPEVIWIDASVGGKIWTQPGAAGLHHVRMGERDLYVERDRNEAVTLGIIIQWIEAGVLIRYWSEKRTEIEALNYVSTLSVF